ncbi:MAG: DUF1573 domain-containing protein [Phycisphaerales bacterium]|nr:MAG: DUF1573 domain-containing protein [Phycisphaerales bacterium]
MREHPHRVGLLVLLILIVVIAAGWGLWYFTVGRGPLAGDLHHDFGTVAITGRKTTVRHVFNLTNRTGETLTIRDIRSSCGCAAAKPSQDQLAPGQSVDLDAGLALTRSGLKKARISLVLDDDRIVTLHMTAIGRQERVLSYNEGRLKDGGLPVSATRSTVVTLFAEIIDNDDPPAKLKWSAPDGMAVSFSEWSQRIQRKRATHEPARWLAQMTISPVTQPLDEDAAVVIEYPPDEQLTIPLRAIGAADREQKDPPSQSESDAEEATDS